MPQGVDAEARREGACGNDAAVVRVDALTRWLILKPCRRPRDKGDQCDERARESDSDSTARQPESAFWTLTQEASSLAERRNSRPGQCSGMTPDAR